MTTSVSEVEPPNDAASSTAELRLDGAITTTRAWVALALMTLISASSYMDRTILGMLVAPIRADLHISDVGFSYLTGMAFALMYVGLGIPFGWVSDRVSRRAMISVGCIAWSAMTTLCGTASSYAQLFLCRVGVGVGEASLQPCAYPLIGQYFPVGRTARAMSIYNMGQPIGAGLSMIIGGVVIGALTAVGPVSLPIFGPTPPWQVVFFVVGLPGLVLGVLAAVILRDPPRVAQRKDQPSFLAGCRFMWRERKVYAPITLGLCGLSILSQGGAAWFPAFLMRVHGFSPTQAGLFIGISSGVGGIVGNLVMGAVADRLMAKGCRDIAGRVLIPAAFGALVCGALAPIIPIPWLSLTLFFCSGLFLATPVGLFHTIRQAVTPKVIWGQVTSIYIFFTNLVGLALGPTAVALCTTYLFHDDKAVNYSIALVGAAAMIVMILALFLGRHRVAERMGAPAPI